MNWAILTQRLDQFDLRAFGAILTRRIDEAHLHALRGQVERLMRQRRAHDVAIIGKRRFERRRRNTDMVQAAEFHVTSIYSRHPSESWGLMPLRST